ncbi:MAG: hypothetical protein IT270_02370 [Saprospiraceae bacterium]|nr:hypothetical protein [Saprospiraceae bacterium]
MKRALPIAIRAAFTFFAMKVIVYMIPYYFLTFGGIVAGLFLFKTGDDRNLGVGMLIGSIAFGIFEYLYNNGYLV